MIRRQSIWTCLKAVRVELISLGVRLYAHRFALGKVLLAFQEADEVKRIIQTAFLPRFTDNTITNEDELIQALAKIRKQEYDEDLEEIHTRMRITHVILGE